MILAAIIFKMTFTTFNINQEFTFNSTFVVKAVSFVFKSEFFTRLEMSNLSTKSFSFIFASNMLTVNLL